MESMFSALAFAVLITAQFAAVVAVCWSNPYQPGVDGARPIREATSQADVPDQVHATAPMLTGWHPLVTAGKRRTDHVRGSAERLPLPR
jgi:hypothetical protein